MHNTVWCIAIIIWISYSIKVQTIKSKIGFLFNYSDTIMRLEADAVERERDGDTFPLYMQL